MTLRRHSAIQESLYHAVDPKTYLTPMLSGYDDEPDDDDDDEDEDEDEELVLASRLPPPVPTCAIPGTDEKILILATRYEQGRDLWHGEDYNVFPRNIYRIDLSNPTDWE